MLTSLQHCGVRLLLAGRRFHRRVGFRHALGQRCVSLGIDHGWKVWSRVWFLRWLVELPGMGLGCCFHVFDYGPADCLHVCADAPGLRSFNLERLRRHAHFRLGVLLHCFVHEPLPALYW